MDSDKILSIGKASIFKSYPDWLQVKVSPNYNKVPGPANPIAGSPVPTNKWFSPLFWWKYDLDINTTPAGTPLRPMPALLQMYTWGLMLAYRDNPQQQAGNCGWPAGKSEGNCSNNTFWPFDTSPNANFNAMVISVDKLLVDKEKNPFFVKASAFGDWDATLEWDDGERRLQLTGLAGGPMLYGTASGGELEFQLPFGDPDHPITFYDGQGKSLGEAYIGANPGPNLAGSKDGILGLALKTQYGETVYYAIFAPQGTAWSFTQSTNPPDPPPRGGNLSNLKSTNLAAGNQPVYFTVAALPPPPKGVDFPLNALKAFADAAGFHVGGTVFSWDGWDTAKSTITAHYNFPVTQHTGELPTGNPSVITTLFKPHQSLLDETDGSVAYVLGEDNKPYSYNSPRGPLKLVRLPVDTNSKTAHYSITYPYYGYVPALPDQSLSSEELSALQTYLSADSRQSPAATTDFLNDQQPDAYSSGTKLYYKLMQTVFWLQQLQQVEGIPDFRGLGQSVDKQQVIQTLVSFLKADLETFFSATRPPALAYQWHFIGQEANDVGRFTKTAAQPPMPEIFPCAPGADCNPDGDPLLGDGACWKLTQQDLISAQQAGKNPYLVLRGLDFTVNKFANTGPTTDMLLHFAWKQGDPKQTQNISMYAFFAPSSKAADPGKPGDWTQCVWTNEAGKGGIGLKVTSCFGIGATTLEKADTPWRVGNVPYNGTSTSAPNRMAAGNYDVMLVFDCGADCGNFPLMCGDGTIPPNVSAPIWDGWELTVGPVHFQGKPYKFIAYNSVWNSLLGNVSWYGSIENLADHHFGWGYLIKAAALIAQFDTTVEPDTKKPWWDIEQGWGGIVNLMIRDVMDWRKPDEADPDGLTFVRCKYLNPVEGHMYADGSGNSGDGNDEESSSEAVNFANACIEWGAATGQDEIRDMGILLRSIYAQAVPMYWFNVDGDVLPSTTASDPFPLAGQITGAGNKHDTYFSGGPGDAGCASRNSDVVAIETLPVTAGTLRLTLFTPQLKVAWETVANAGGPYCAQDKCYLSTLLSFQALFDAASAKAAFLQLANPQDSFTKWYNCNAITGGLKQPEDHSYATTYAFILSLERLGAAKAEGVSSPDSNPFYMPMADGSLLIYNPTSADRAFSVRGVSVTVPSLRCLHVDAAGVPVARA
ncbi:MAG: glycosyl hydrolase [Acidobacteriota bacterium]